MLLRRTICGTVFASGLVCIVMLDAHLLEGQPGGGFGKGGGGFGKGGGGGFGQPPAGGGGVVQPGGGGGGFGRGGDPERTFGFLSKGGDTIDFSRMTPNEKIFAKSAIEKAGMPSPTDSTVITKAQFLDSYSRAQAARGMTPTAPGGGFGAPPGGGFGAPPGGGFGAPAGGGYAYGPPGGGFGAPGSYGGGMGDGKAVMTFGGGGERRGGEFRMSGPGGGGEFRMGGPGGGEFRMGAGGGPGFGGPGLGGPGFGSPGFGGQGSSGFEREKMGGPTNFRMTDQDIERRFNDSDVNRDGKLSPDEISDRSPLKASFKESDTNQDGYIDLQEYKAYIAARFGGGEGDSASSYGSYAGNGNYGRDGRDLRNEKKEELPVAIRYGKLPTGLPSWWDSLDADKDGQVGLYEWRSDGRDVKEFQKMDLDGDGILAPQEWFRYNVQSAEQAKAIAAEEEIGGAPSTPGVKGGRPAFGPGAGMPGAGSNKGWPGTGGNGKDKASERPDKSSERPEKGSGDPKNPFRSGGKK